MTDVRSASMVIAERISLNVGTIACDAAGHEITANDIMRDLDAAGFMVVKKLVRRQRPPFTFDDERDVSTEAKR